MTYFGELIINGISLGFIYALIALGFVVIFKATEVINFAQGSMLLLGAYVVARLHDNARLRAGRRRRHPGRRASARSSSSGSSSAGRGTPIRSRSRSSPSASTSCSPPS